MRITDYERARNLNDVGLTLTREEAEELYIYLHRMLDRAGPRMAYLSEAEGCGIERELTVSIETGPRALQLSA